MKRKIITLRVKFQIFFQINPKIDSEDDPYDFEWDKFTADDESYWDNIFGKNIDLVS